jgi:hypothetical protein
VDVDPSRVRKEQGAVELPRVQHRDPTPRLCAGQEIDRDPSSGGGLSHRLLDGRPEGILQDEHGAAAGEERMLREPLGRISQEPDSGGLELLGDRMWIEGVSDRGAPPGGVAARGPLPLD